MPAWLVPLIGLAGGGLCVLVACWLDRWQTRRIADEEEATDFGAYWESVAEMLDQADADRRWDTEQTEPDADELDEIGLRRAMRHHPAGKGRRHD